MKIEITLLFAILWSLCFTAGGSAPLRQSNRCPSGWLYFEGQCFKESGDRADINSASRDCSNIKHQGIPAKIAEPQDAFTFSFLRTRLYTTGRWDSWVGISDYHSEGRFVWLSENHLSSLPAARSPFNQNNYVFAFNSKFEYWGPNEPNNYDGAEDCVIWGLAKSWKGWNDEYCENKMYYTCQVPATKQHDPGEETSKLFCPPTFRLFGDNCYRAMFTTKDYLDTVANQGQAQETCRGFKSRSGQPGKLAEPMSLETLKFLTDLMEYQGLSPTRGIWVGARKVGEHFVTLSSAVHFPKELNHASYVDNSGDCGQLYERKLDDVPCNLPRPFICQVAAELPTQSPTLSPTTARPTSSPTTAQPTRSPTVEGFSAVCEALLRQNTCRCGEVPIVDMNGETTCEEGQMSRLDTAMMALRCRQIETVATVAENLALFNLAATCLDPKQALGLADLEKTRGRQAAVSEVVQLSRQDMFRGESSDIVQLLEAQTQAMSALNDKEGCHLPCECGFQRRNGVCVEVRDLVDLLETSRTLAMCEMLGLEDFRPVFEVGTHILLALSCLRKADTDDFTDHARAVLQETGAIATLVHKTMPSSLLSSSITLVRSLRMRYNVEETTPVIPWFTTSFFEKSGSFGVAGLDQVTQSIGEYRDDIRELQLRNDLLDAGRQNAASIADFMSNEMKELFSSMKDAAEFSLTSIQLELESSALTVEEQLTTTDGALESLKDIGDAVENQLDVLGTSMEKLIDAEVNVERKQLLIEKRRAIFNLVKSAINLVSSAFTAGKRVAKSIVSAAQAKRPFLKAGSIFAKKLGEKAVKVGKDLAGNLAKLDMAKGRLEDKKNLIADAVMSSIPIVSDIKAIVDSISTMRNYKKKVKELEEKRVELKEQADAKIDVVSEQLEELSAKVTSMSISLMAASEWMFEGQLDIADTKVDPNLMESTLAWSRTQAEILQSLIDLEICPGPGASNPWRSRRMLLDTARVETASFTTTSRGRLQLRRNLAMSETPYTTFRRSLGRKDTEEERKIAAEAWDAMVDQCASFGSLLEEFVKWGAETQTLFFQSIRSIRDRIVLEGRQNAQKNMVGVWDKAVVDSAARLDQFELDTEKELALRTQFNAVLFAQALGIELSSLDTIEHLCKTYQYAKPNLQLPGFTVPPTNDGLRLIVDTTKCTARFTSSGLAGLQHSWTDRIDVLHKTLSSSDLSNVWKKAILRESSSVFLRDVACNLTQRSFLEDVVKPDQKSAWFDIRLNSFSRARGNNCFQNAEVRDIQVFFLAENGDPLPRRGTSVNLHFDSTDRFEYLKYTANAESSQLVELPFLASDKRRSSFEYYVPQDGNCGNDNEITLSGRKVVCSIPRQRQDNIFMQMPLYGRWTVKLLRDWPADEEMPATAEVRVHIAYEVCEGNNFASVYRNGSRPVTQEVLELGRVCGGRDFPSLRSIAIEAGTGGEGDNDGEVDDPDSKNEDDADSEKENDDDSKQENEEATPDSSQGNLVTPALGLLGLQFLVRSLV